jgi:hypothetical protein
MVWLVLLTNVTRRVAPDVSAPAAGEAGAGDAAGPVGDAGDAADGVAEARARAVAEALADGDPVAVTVRPGVVEAGAEVP